MKLLTKDQIILMHEELVNDTGGIIGIRDDGLLESAMAQPFQRFAGKQLYETLEEKAARLCFGIVKNHPMLDGNKRLGAHAMSVFLALNGVELDYTQEELSSIILQIASSEKSYEDLLHWIKTHET